MVRKAGHPRAGIAVLVLAAAAGPTSCGNPLNDDPVRDESIAALGPEPGDVRPGPLHRPGQPCVVCHSDAGNAPSFSLGGTVYVDKDSRVPVSDVAMVVIDAKNLIFKTNTNCAGNFFVRTAEFSPHYPIWLSLRAPGVARDMDSPVYREGSCAPCHSDPRSPTSAGHVYLVDDPMLEAPPPQDQCK
jgi:hypothetical protein